jgi:hypothetical protein
MRNIFKDKSGKIVLGQAPNIPMVSWLIFTVISRVFPGFRYVEVLKNAATISVVIWALLEIFLGVNTFRRLLGLVVLFFSLR